MLSAVEREMLLACRLHTGCDYSQTRFLKECTPEKLEEYFTWSDEEIDSLQQECNDKDDEISKLEEEVARKLEASEAKLADKDDRISDLEEELAALKADITSLNK